MIGLWQTIEYCAGSAMLALMLMALGYSIAVPTTDRWSKNFFITFFSLLTICVIAAILDLYFYKNPNFENAERIACYVETLFFSVLMPMPTMLLIHYCKEKFMKSRLLFIAIILWVVFFILLEIGFFTDFFFVITPENDFHRTRWFPFLVSPLVVIMLLNITGLIQRRKKLSKRYFIAFLIYLLPMTAFMILHMFEEIELTVFLGVGICALSMYSIITSDHIVQNFLQQRKIAEQEREIAHQRAEVMVLQIRPHFIYNTMMSIYYLCKQDADKAQQVTLDFTTYLRKNFTAIVGENLVPFNDELEHTRAYLAVEQAQHEDMLYVEYDTPHTDFSVPPLTLQPLVENAVKHSLDPNGDPLRIYIKTRKKDEGSEIIVENNGLDYQPSDDNEPHIALSNIKQRLELMCKGEMTIIPRKGGGTIVTVMIPRT